MQVNTNGRRAIFNIDICSLFYSIRVASIPTYRPRPTTTTGFSAQWEGGERLVPGFVGVAELTGGWVEFIILDI